VGVRGLTLIKPWTFLFKLKFLHFENPYVEVS
jgi:hypothetical protein